MANMLLIANYKMNCNNTTITAVSEYYTNEFTSNTPIEVILCPPYPYLSLVNGIIKPNPSIKLGAQNVAAFSKGSYTGEVSASMLYGEGCKYVIIGHSERRKNFHEENGVIKAKVNVAVCHGLTPILCVGEELESRKNKLHLEVIGEQIRTSEIAIHNQYIIAYEPVWAIGTGFTPTPEEIQEAVNYIRTITSSYIVYGGSVNSKNISDFLHVTGLDGFLVGGASLDAQEFSSIYRTLSCIKSN